MLLLHVVLTILLLNRTTGEEVDVVEAISGSSSESDSNNDHHHKEQPVNGAIQQRDESDRGTGNAGGNADQVALESGSDQESAASHGYSQSLRGSASHVHHQKPFPPAHHPANVPPPGSYHGPPPPLPPPPLHQKPTVTAALETAMDKLYTAGGGGGNGDQWPLAVSDAPKIISLDVKCEKNSMKVYIAFDKPFYGIVFSKGHYSNLHCVHLPAGLGRTSHTFEVSVHACGTSGNTENGLYGYGSDSGSGSYFENTIVIQYDPQVQEVWDQARKLRCTWHDQYEKSVTFRPFPVDMLDVIRADFAGDNVGCWMQIQVGKGPWASEVSGLVKIGQTMTMVLAIKDDDSKFDMLVRNCMAHDGKRAPIQLVDQRGCVTRTKLMSRFTKIKNFGASASVLSYAHFQAFKFPDSMEVHFQCTIQICRYQCPDQCSTDPLALLQPHHENILSAHHGAVRPDAVYGGPPPPPLPLEVYLRGGGGGVGVGTVTHGRRDERRAKKPKREATAASDDPEKEIGVNRIIKVVSSGDLTFALDDSGSGTGNGSSEFPPVVGSDNYYSSRNKWIADQDVRSSMICMTSFSFSATLVFLLAVLFVSCLLSSILCIRLRSSSAKATASPTSHQTSTNANRRIFSKNCCFYS